VDGVNLRQAMRAGRFTPEQALSVVPRICEALQFAHNEGVLHRDIKPENILLDAKGRVKIADFGIAKLLGESAAKGHLTDSGGTLGTPHYMAPEQIENPASVDHRADIYSLGVVFYEMLTGELPLGKFQPPSQKVRVDVRFDEVVLHALEKEPARRYQQASEVKTAVDTITSAPPADPNRRPVAASHGPAQKLWPFLATAFHWSRSDADADPSSARVSLFQGASGTGPSRSRATAGETSPGNSRQLVRRNERRCSGIQRKARN